MPHILVLCVLLLLTTLSIGCSDDPKPQAQAQPDASEETPEPEPDAPEVPEDTPEPDPDIPDPEPDAPDPQPDAMPDAEPDAPDPPKECVQASITGSWTLQNADDVSIEYDAILSPVVDGQYILLSLLFERYNIGADIGTFELGGDGPDGNFGTCPHCVFMRGQTAERAYFADSGTLTTIADPYSRRLDARVEGLRLIEVAVNPETRASTPIEGGGCVEVADFTATGNFPESGWTCPLDQYGDGESCQCECGAVDPDCNAGGPCPPFDPNCVETDRLPVVDCEAQDFCAFDPEIFSTACTEACDWRDRQGCDQGVCVYNNGASRDGIDICIDSEARLSRVALGERCNVNQYQQFCEIVDGFAQGYCGPADTCRPICETDEECPVPGETCRRFLVDEGLGYCGPEPEDG